MFEQRDSLVVTESVQGGFEIVCLTEREVQVLGLLQRGFDATAIARELNISTKNVRNRTSSILGKINVGTRYGLITEVYKEKDSRLQLEGQNIENPLGPREREVLRLLLDGKAVKETARIMDISDKTVRNHRTHILEKVEDVFWAAGRNLSPDDLYEGRLYYAALINGWQAEPEAGENVGAE